MIFNLFNKWDKKYKLPVGDVDVDAVIPQWNTPTGIMHARVRCYWRRSGFPEFADEHQVNIKKSTDCVLLGVLMLGSKHGYEIRQFLDESLESKWHIGNSQMYSLLKQLEEKRLLESYLKIQTKRPSKRVYSLTPKGETKFLQWIERPVMHVRNLRIEFIVKLFFIHRLSLPSGNIVLRNQIEALKHILGKICDMQCRENLPFERLSLRFRQVTIEAYMQWLETTVRPFVDQTQDL